MVVLDGANVIESTSDGVRELPRDVRKASTTAEDIKCKYNWKYFFGSSFCFADFCSFLSNLFLCSKLSSVLLKPVMEASMRYLIRLIYSMWKDEASAVCNPKTSKIAINNFCSWNLPKFPRMIFCRRSRPKLSINMSHTQLQHYIYSNLHKMKWEQQLEMISRHSHEFKFNAKKYSQQINGVFTELLLTEFGHQMGIAMLRGSLTVPSSAFDTYSGTFPEHSPSSMWSPYQACMQWIITYTSIHQNQTKKKQRSVQMLIPPKIVR